jgi:hypothetical protein
MLTAKMISRPLVLGLQSKTKIRLGAKIFSSRMRQSKNPFSKKEK